MRRVRSAVCLSALLGVTPSISVCLGAVSDAAPAQGEKKPSGEPEKAEGSKFEPFKPESVVSTGSVTIAGQTIPYQAIAGTLVVHPKDWDDMPRDSNPEKGPAASPEEGADAKNPTAEASIRGHAQIDIRACAAESLPFAETTHGVPELDRQNRHAAGAGRRPGGGVR